MCSFQLTIVDNTNYKLVPDSVINNMRAAHMHKLDAACLAQFLLSELQARGHMTQDEILTHFNLGNAVDIESEVLEPLLKIGLIQRMEGRTT